MRNPQIEEKALKLLLSPNEEDILLSIELLREYTFEDLRDMKDVKPSSANTRGFEMWFIEKPSVYPYRGSRRYLLNNTEIDIWQSIIFFVKK